MVKLHLSTKTLEFDTYSTCVLLIAKYEYLIIFNVPILEVIFWEVIKKWFDK